MSGKGSLKRSCFKGHCADPLESRENFNRLKSVFEIKRPNKSPSSTLRKYKSASTLSSHSSDDDESKACRDKVSSKNNSDGSSTNSKYVKILTKSKNKATTQISDDEELKVGKDRVFVRNSSSRSSTRSNKYKRVGYRQSLKENCKNTYDNKIENAFEHIDKLVEEFHAKLREKRASTRLSADDFDVRLNNDHLQTFYKVESKYDTNKSENDDKPCDEDSNRNSTDNDDWEVFSNNDDLLNQECSDENNRHKRKEIHSFLDAESEGDTDSYRRSLVNEMDLEVAQMKLDGFIDDEENSSIINEYNIEPLLENVNVSRVNVSRYKLLFEGIGNFGIKNGEVIDKEYQSTINRRKESNNLDNRDQIDNEHTDEEEHCDNTEVRSNFEHENQCNDEEYLVNQNQEPEEVNEDAVEYVNVFPYNQIQEAEEVNEDPVEYVNVFPYNQIQEAEEVNEDTVEYVHVFPYSNDENHAQIEATSDAHIFSSEEAFYESLGDDLENGSYFVEAYNDEGRELVIVEISLERRTVNLDQPFALESLKKSINNSDMVFQEKHDKSLNVIENPKEFVNDTGLICSGFSIDPQSNRSTLYSNASRDSEVFDDDDEGISLGSSEHRDHSAYNNVRRETFCDDKGIVRIERIGFLGDGNSTSTEDGSEPMSPVSRNSSFAQRGKLSYIIEEIKSTENKYVEDLRKVVTKYMPYIARHTPENLKGRECYIFGNIETLYDHQKQFRDALAHCGEDVDDVVNTFISFEYMFEIYPKYFKNKPRADMVLKDFGAIIRQAQEKFHERLDLSSYLLTPLQRLGKYKLFLENIEKQLQQLELPTEHTVKALETIKREMSKGNDFVAIESIEYSPINKIDYGSFKMREKFIILKPRRIASMVFLFENIIVFTLCDPRNMEMYNYLDSIKMADLRIATFEDFTIHLTDYTKSKKTSRTDRYTYVIEAKTEKIKDTWRKAIEDILWQQLFKAKESTLKMYQSKGAKRSVTTKNRIKSTGSSIFYIT